MTRQLIEITFGNAVAQAKQLDECADAMVRLANNSIGNIKSDLNSAWQGDSANAYIAKLDLTSENIITTANKLYEIARTIRKVARIFRESELRVLALAQERSY